MQNRIIVDEELRALGEDASLFVGRKTSVYQKHGIKAAMYMGIVTEEKSDSAGYYGKRVLMDSISPHAVFICGMRGSGKSYTLGVIAEELALKNDAVGAIVIDPMGIFWSMKKPNEVGGEKTMLTEWELKPTGIKNMKVFIPAGYAKEAPRETWDKIFTIRPPELTVEDWCLTFGFDRFDVMGLLIERVMERVREGYTTKDGQHVEGLGDSYDIEDLITCIESEEGIHSPKHGFKNSTRRALVARLKGALEWGIFDKKGTQLRDLARRGQITVIDVSFLQDNVRALVVGLLARAILNTRKRISRKEAVGVTDLMDAVPVTWLMIDEAHILVPGAGRKTAATDALIEYVRQGRQPGCSIVLATQQPSAIDSRILSQMDVVFCHKLVYEDDIKAVIRRMPSEMPERFQEDYFIKNLSIGVAIIGDKQEETSRCFLASIRPRISQHEGRERQPILDVDVNAIREDMKKLIREKWGKESKEELKKLVKTVNEEYKLNLSFSELLNELEEEGFVEVLEGGPEVRSSVTPRTEISDREAFPGVGENSKVQKKAAPEPAVEMPGLKGRHRKMRVILSAVDDSVEEIAEKEARRILFKKDIIYGITKFYYPLYQVFFDYYPLKGKYVSLSCFIDGITGEILLKKGRRTRGIRDLMGLNPEQRSVMFFIMRRRQVTLPEIARAGHLDEKKVKKTVNSLVQKEFLTVKPGSETRPEVMRSAIELTISGDPRKKVVNFLPIADDAVEDEAVIPPVLAEKEAKKAAEIWERSSVWDVSLVYYPYFVITYQKKVEVIDGVTGKKDDYVKSMVAFRL